MKPFQKIIWAANPLEDRSTRNRSIQILRELSKKTQATIEPVYVLSDGLLSVSIPKADLIKQFKPVSEKALANLVKGGRIAKLVSPTVLVSAPSSRMGAAKALDRYARKKHADLILVNSHGRSGLRRMLMGSFAETLTMYSKTPILISGPKTKHIEKLNSILFPTDFSKESKKAFQHVQEMAKKMHASITLFHAVVNPIQPMVQSGAELLGGGFVWTQGSYEKLFEAEEKLAKTWAAEARRKGISIKTVVDIAPSGVVHALLSYAKKQKTAFIAMASESGPVAAAILGSIGREVAREAPCPVWFLRT